MLNLRNMRMPKKHVLAWMGYASLSICSTLLPCYLFNELTLLFDLKGQIDGNTVTARFLLTTRAVNRSPRRRPCMFYS